MVLLLSCPILQNAQVRGFYDFYLPRDEIWIYNMETGRWYSK